MKKTLMLLFFTVSISLNAQSNFKVFLKSSCPIKKLVVFHPFKAKKALAIALEPHKVSDSIAKINVLVGDASGVQVDAFRHPYWLPRSNHELGIYSARSLGKHHEKHSTIIIKK